MRLVGGLNNSSGRVEVLRDGVWGTVCDDNWDFKDATVVCQQLGFRSAQQALSAAYFGPGSGKIWMDNVRCSGDERSLGECKSRGWGIHNCQHTEDAAVNCTGKGLIMGRGKS